MFKKNILSQNLLKIGSFNFIKVIIICLLSIVVLIVLKKKTKFYRQVNLSLPSKFIQIYLYEIFNSNICPASVTSN